MIRAFTRLLARLTLGPAARAARPKLDDDAKLAMAPRELENELHEHDQMPPGARRIGHLVVIEGGRQGAAKPGTGPFGGPAPVPLQGRGKAVRRA